MLNNISIGTYINKDSIVHKLNPVFKIISLIIMLISVLNIKSYISLIVLTLYLITSILYSNINIKVYLKNIYGIKIFLVFIIIVDLVFYNGINTLVFDLFKLIFIVMYSSILTYTTAITEITYGLEKILSPLKKILPIGSIVMIITLSIRYIPTITEEANRIINIQKLRGINFKSKNIKEKLISISGIFIPMFTLSLKKADKTSDIMEIRLYGYSNTRTNYRFNKWKIRDSLLLILNILILIIVICY